MIRFLEKEALSIELLNRASNRALNIGTSLGKKMRSPFVSTAKKDILKRLSRKRLSQAARFGSGVTRQKQALPWHMRKVSAEGRIRFNVFGSEE